MEMSDIVSVSISIADAAITQAGFGIMNICGDSAVLPDQDVVTLTNDAAMVTANVYGGKLNGVPLAGAGLTFVTDNDTTMTAIAAIIQGLVEVSTAIASDVGSVGYYNTITVTSTANTSNNFTEMAITGGASQPTVTVAKTTTLTRARTYANAVAVAVDFATTDPEYIAAIRAFGQSPAPTSLIISRRDVGEDWDVALPLIVLENNTWYFLIATTRTKAEIEAIAAWTEANKKLFVTSSDDAGIITSGTADIAYSLSLSGYHRSSVIYHDLADLSITDDWIEAAWIGLMSTYDPGEATWMFKSLTGVAVMTLTSTESGYALGKNCNTYESLKGISMMREGQVASGRYLDIQRGADWLQSDIEERVYSLMINVPKIPFTDPGIAMIESRIKASLAEGIEIGLITADPAPTTSVPAVADVSTADKANRQLTSISFAGVLSGGIHFADIDGTLTV